MTGLGLAAWVVGGFLGAVALPPGFYLGCIIVDRIEKWRYSKGRRF